MNTGSLILHKNSQEIATTGSDYLVGNNLEVLYELLQGGFLEDDIDFGRKLDSVMNEGEKKKKECLNVKFVVKNLYLLVV